MAVEPNLIKPEQKINSASEEKSDAAFFTQYRDRRAAVRPKKCAGGPKCWVEYGPPCMSSHVQCVGCQGAPFLPEEARPKPTPWRKSPGRHDG